MIGKKSITRVKGLLVIIWLAWNQAHSRKTTQINPLNLNGVLNWFFLQWYYDAFKSNVKVAIGMLNAFRIEFAHRKSDV